MAEITPRLISFYDALKSIFMESHQGSPLSIMSPNDNLLIKHELSNINDSYVFVDLDEFPEFLKEYNKQENSKEKKFELLSNHLIEFIRNELIDRNKYYTFLGFDIAFIKTPDNFVNTGIMLEYCTFHKI